MAASPLQTLPLSALAKQTIHEVTQLHFKSLEYLKSKKCCLAWPPPPLCVHCYCHHTTPSLAAHCRDISGEEILTDTE